MAENPFQPPSVESRTRKENGKSTVHFSVVSIVVVLAVLTGFSYAANFAPLVFIVPAIAIIVVGTARSDDAVQGVRMASSTLAVVLAGYIAFATTCCCTNLSLIENLGRNYSPPLLKGGVVSAVSTILGCFVAYGLKRWQRRRFAGK